MAEQPKQAKQPEAMQRLVRAAQPARPAKQSKQSKQSKQTKQTTKSKQARESNTTQQAQAAQQAQQAQPAEQSLLEEQLSQLAKQTDSLLQPQQLQQDWKLMTDALADGGEWRPIEGRFWCPDPICPKSYLQKTFPGYASVRSLRWVTITVVCNYILIA